MTPEQLFYSAVNLQQQGRLAEAESLYRQVLALAPDAVDAWINHGAALQGLGRPEEALGSYDQAVTRGPGHAAAWTNRAQALLALNRPAPALESFDRVVRLSPRHAGAWRGRAGALFSLGRSDEALASLDRALEIEPADADTLYRRAAILHVEQRFAAALTALDGILAIHPDHSDALTLKAAVLCETGQTADGMAVYRRHAQTHFAQAPVTQIADADFKRKHDAEQRAWMHAHGIVANGFHLEAGARTDGPAVNPANAGDVARRWAQSDPQIVVIDDLLTPDALDGLRRFAHGSTMWRRSYPNGYLGAVPEQGFSCPLLAQIAEELQSVFPTVIGGHGLGLMWGFKYDSRPDYGRSGGIPMHADQAKVNVNFWIAPDDANRDAQSGGLVVWDVKPPPDWDFSRYNGNESAIRAFLAQSDAKPITVPHRANRAVIFDSDLFHATDRIDFREGYENRRINVTMLYGRRTFRGQ